MEPHDQVQAVDPDAAAGAAAAFGNGNIDVAAVLGNVVAERDARLERARPLELAIPTWGGHMVAVYGYLSDGEYNRYVEKIGPKTKPSLDQLTDVILAACRGIYLVEKPDELEGSIFDKDNDYKPKPGVAIVAPRYGNELRRRLGDKVPEKGPARELVLHMFAERATVVAAHGGDVFEWLQGGSQEVERDLTGESDRS